MLITFYIPVILSFSWTLLWVMILSPLLVMSGSRTILTNRSRALALLAGRLSYPICILNYPVFTWVNRIDQTITHRQDVEIEEVLPVVTVIVASYAAPRL